MNKLPITIYQYLNKDNIIKFSLNKKNNKILNDECIICYSTDNDIIITVCCNKSFCNNCLTKWLKESESCPHCRNKTEIKQIEHICFKSYFNKNNMNNKKKYILIKYKVESEFYSIFNKNKNIYNIEIIGISYFNLNITKQILLKNSINYNSRYLSEFWNPTFFNLNPLLTIINNHVHHHIPCFSIIELK